MYQYLPTFLFRTPFFSYSNLLDFEKKQHESVFREMLQIASPDLSINLDKSEDKAQKSAYRYYQRSCTRSTPFGLFAGCSTGTIGEQTEIKLSEQEDYRRVTRLDMNFICAMIQLIEKDRSVREQLYYYQNTSLYPVGNHLRYVECHFLKLHRIHQITKVENSEYLHKVLSSVKTGAKFSELVASLTDDEITADVATEFIHDLIDAKVLVSELDPAVTNVQPLSTLIAKLNALPDVNKNLIDILSKIESQLNDIDRMNIGNSLNIYSAIIKNIEKTNIETEIKYLFQADMFKPAQQATVSHRILQDIKQALIFLNKINMQVTQDNIIQFRDNFIKRYGDREISMLFVLDNEVGIGYANNTSGDISPLIDDLSIPKSVSSNAKSLPIQSILMQRYQQSQQKVIELTDDDVKGSEAVWEDLQPTFSVICQILQDNDHGRSVYIQSAGGSSASSLLGRFCHLDNHILNHTLNITQKEESMNPDIIYAEIVHLPESRIGNILLRPILRQYEISYLAKSGVNEEFEIRPDDLYVSIKNNRIVLRSKRLDKEIIPRMSTAHNYSGQNSMPVYHFLCDLQNQNRRSGLGFQWNDAAQQLDYLPRVIYKNCILSQARWLVHEKEIKTFKGIQNNNELLLKVKDWQLARSIPDIALLSDGDNELYIDMNNPLSIRAWLSIIKKRSVFRLEEFLFDPKTAVVHGPEGVFTNEFIFAFYRND